MLAIFRALPLLWRVASIAAVVLGIAGAVGGVYLYVRHEGYVDGFDQARKQCEAEKAAQQAANEAAIEIVRKALAKTAEELTIKDAEIDDYVKALDLASEKAADSGEQCLSVERVRRLNSIK